MSKSRFNRKVGKWHRGWARFKAFVLGEDEVKKIERLSRQRRRAAARTFAWNAMSGQNALRDDHGIIPRRTRRKMALTLAKRKVAA